MLTSRSVLETVNPSSINKLRHEKTRSTSVVKVICTTLQIDCQLDRDSVNTEGERGNLE